ncbi:hypothetical protein [Salidesulfovibrio onnuriiensis]|uniref:hypothetical protein n=1 Tax=Salidesulfovibrio onnuriiensis TaxID=2583823 RepID=UPI0011CBCF4C|nr:hypothetical protein [Salidesulfovibrio onnuriiensis]
MKAFRFIAPLLLLALCACMPATLGDIVFFEGQPAVAQDWMGDYDYVPKKGESFEAGHLPLLAIDATNGMNALLRVDEESYGGLFLSSRIPGSELYVLAFPEFLIRSGSSVETFERVFFIARKIESTLYVWDVLAESLGPAPWHVDKVRKFLQNNPDTFDINKPGLVFRKKA